MSMIPVSYTHLDVYKRQVSANADLHSRTAKLKPIETAIREKKDLQKQVLAYAKTRDVRDGLKKQKTDKARKAYREKHESDFIIADAACLLYTSP